LTGGIQNDVKKLKDFMIKALHIIKTFIGKRKERSAQKENFKKTRVKKRLR